MLNGYALNKKMHEHKQLVRQQDKLKTWYDKRKKSNRNNMAESYKRRVEKFIFDMVDNPIIMNKRIKKAPKEPYKRIPNNSQMMGAARILIRGYKTENERIQEAVEQQKYLEIDPIKKAAERHDFRPRDQSKEICGNMIFDFKSEIQRYTSQLEENISPPIEEAVPRKSKVKERAWRKSLTKNRTMPKLHFQGAAGISMGVGCLKHIAEKKGEDERWLRNNPAALILHQTAITKNKINSRSMSEMEWYNNKKLDWYNPLVKSKSKSKSKSKYNCKSGLEENSREEETLKYLLSINQSKNEERQSRLTASLPSDFGGDHMPSLPKISPLLLHHEGEAAKRRDGRFLPQKVAFTKDNVPQMAREVLDLCNVNTKKAYFGQILLAGEGKLAGSNNYTNTQVYNSLDNTITTKSSKTKFGDINNIANKPKGNSKFSLLNITKPKSKSLVPGLVLNVPSKPKRGGVLNDLDMDFHN